MKPTELELTTRMKRRLKFYEHFFIENLQNPGTVWLTIFTRRYNKNVQIIANYMQSEVVEVADEENCTNEETPTAQFVFDQLTSPPMIQSMDYISTLENLLQILQVTTNKTLATVLSIDPETFNGSLIWEKIVFDLWDDLVNNINYHDLSEYLLLSKAIFPTEDERIVTEFTHNSDRVVQLLCLLAQRYQDMDILQRALYFLGTVSPSCLGYANKLGTNMEIEEFEWLQWHRDIFIFQAKQLDDMALELTKKSLLSVVDLKRLERLKTEQAKAKYMFDTLQRKSGPIMYSLITACHRSGNEDLAFLMELQPIDIQISWNAFQLIQFNWTKLISQVQYERIATYLVSRKFLRYRDHVQCQEMERNEEKMRFVLKQVLTRQEDFYEAFFHILSLQPGLKQLFQNCFPMSFEEKKIILECQDFLAQHMQFTDQVCEQLCEVDLLTTSDHEYINRMCSTLTKNLAICNILKTKSAGSVNKLLSVLWKTKNRNCAEILAIDFQNFQMSIAEWLKLKSNWVDIVKAVNIDSVSGTLVHTGVISDEEYHWIERSPKNRQRMRKLLRILPNKKRGYTMLLLGLSQFDEYHHLLLQCQPMIPWELNILQENLEYLTDNTKNLAEILQELLSRKILTENEAKLITYYEEPVQELYMTLMGKDNGLIDHLIEILEMTDNYDASAILTIDLFSVTCLSHSIQS